MSNVSRFLAWIILLAGIGMTPPAAFAAKSPEAARQELDEVRTRMEKLKTSVEKDVTRRDSVLASLRNEERTIGRLRKRLRELTAEREASEARLANLERALVQRRGNLDAERDKLAGQLRASYIGGREERLKLLLNQQDPARLGRFLIYYRYFNSARVDQIDAVLAEIRELENLEAELAAETTRLAGLEKEQKAKITDLSGSRKRRSDLVAKLGKKIKRTGREIKTMQREERDLVGLIEKLTTALKEFPMDPDEPFGKFKGKLDWPVTGPILEKYGAPRAGGRLKWQGVLVSANRGTPVRAVARGRIAFADWLPGLGLLVIVEHGDGYLTLYGHNESLEKGIGDWVEAGEPVATVGDSGGRPEPALYFELRKGKNPMNPRPWFDGKSTGG